jgi:integrase
VLVPQQTLIDRLFLLALRYKGRYAMSIRMAKLTRSKNGDFVSRKGIPADVREAYTRLHRGDAKAALRVTRPGGTLTAPKVWEELFKRPGSISPSAARVAWAEWCAEIDTRVASLRAAARGEGQPITQRNAVALAGKWYSWFLAQHENDARLASHWAELRDYLIWDVIGREAPDEYKADTDADPHWEWAKAPEVRDAIRPIIVELARPASFLASAGISLDDNAYKLFTNAVSDLLFSAFCVLEQRAKGDYTPDETPKQFPAFIDGAAKRAEGLSCWALFEAWVIAAKRAGSSVRRARGVFIELEAKFSRTSASALTARDAKVWIDGLITEKRTAFTVANVWLANSKSVFRWGVEQELIPANPFAGIKITKQRKIRKRSGKTFTKKEAAIILEASEQIVDLKTPMVRAKRWVPLLCAYTGARAGEMTQLRGEDVKKVGEVYYATLTPSAGTIKSGQARTVPLHEHLVELGFIPFVLSRKPGPMFYKASTGTTALDPLNPKRGPAVKTRERLGEWVRSLGVTDPELSPSHAWRHTFLSKARQAGIEAALRFGITGHAPKSIGETYGQPEPEELAEALKKFPRYDFVTRPPRKVGFAVGNR